MKASAGALPHIWINHFVAQELDKYEDCGVTLNPASVDLPDTIYLAQRDENTGFAIDPNAELLSVPSNTPGNIIPFFPAAPTNIEQIYQDLLVYSGETNPLLVSYDRMLRLRPSPLYIHKREQLMYYLYNGSVDILFNAGNVISQLLDREDEAARQLNAWMTQKQASNNPIIDSSSGRPLELNIFFRNLKVYQADEGRDLLELGTVKTVYTNKYIIEYDYHRKTEYYS